MKHKKSAEKSYQNQQFSHIIPIIVAAKKAWWWFKKSGMVHNGCLKRKYVVAEYQKNHMVKNVQWCFKRVCKSKKHPFHLYSDEKSSNKKQIISIIIIKMASSLEQDVTNQL